MSTQYTLADFTVMVGTVAPADVDVSCAAGTITEGADEKMQDGIPTACENYPPQVYTGTRYTLQIDGAADDNAATGESLAVFLRSNVGRGGVLTLTPVDAAKGLPTVTYDVSAWLWPAVKYPADGPAEVSTAAMALTGPPTYTPGP